MCDECHGRKIINFSIKEQTTNRRNFKTDSKICSMGLSFNEGLLPSSVSAIAGV